MARGRGPTVDHLTRRVLTVAFAAVCFQPLYNQGRLLEWGGPAYALLLVALLVLTALCDAVLAAALAHTRTRWPFGPLLWDELRATLGIGSAVCATGAVMSLAVAVVGLWALPVFSLPLLLTQLSFRRYAAVRVTYRQTIASSRGRPRSPDTRPRGTRDGWPPSAGPSGGSWASPSPI